MTTPHPTPEERYEAAGRRAESRFKGGGSAAYMLDVRNEMIAAIREAEAAGEARGRAVPQPGPSDPIPSQPDEREAIKTALIAAGCDTGDGSYVHAAMDSVIAAILAMQAERRGATRPTIPTCCVTGAIPGDGGACGDCDPCTLGENMVPDAVKRLIAEKNSLRQRVGELEDQLHEAPAQPVPIAGLEPVAWRFAKRSVWHVTSEHGWADVHGDCVEPLYTRAQLEAHAAEQVRAERERNPLNQLPNDLYWLIGKGKTRPDEPLYGVQLLEPGSLKIIAEAEHDDLTEAIAAAIRARGQV